MNPYRFLLVAIFIYSTCQAQNYVVNGDFEQYSTCPLYDNQIEAAVSWICPERPLGCSSEYFNACSPTGVSVPVNNTGYQNARSGGGYAGIYLWSQPLSNYREFIEGTLCQPLSANTTYHFKMYFNLGDYCGFVTSSIGVYFSDTLITSLPFYVPLPFTPQIKNAVGNKPDSLSWTQVSGSFTATGGERFFIIGSFDNDSVANPTVYYATGVNIIYVFIDDVSLTGCPAYSLTYNTTDATPGHNDGAVEIIASDPMPVYHYSLDNLVFQTNNTFSGLDSGTYHVFIIDCAGCRTQGTFRINAPCAPLVLNFSITDGTPGLNNGAVKVNVSGGYPPYLYSLDSITFQNSSTFTGLDTGTYQTFVTDSNGCTAQGSFIITHDTTIGVQIIKGFDTRIFPNPVQDKINIESEGPSEISIYDITSRKVLQQQFTNATSLNVSSLASGLYIYQLKRNGTVIRDKLIKE